MNKSKLELADAIEERSYYKHLTEPEIQKRKEEFTANALKIDDLEEQKKSVLEEFKESLKPLKTNHNMLAREIRSGVAKHEGKLYKFIDHDTKMAYYYDEDGNKVESETRLAESEELQTNIYQLNRDKNGTTDE